MKGMFPTKLPILSSSLSTFSLSAISRTKGGNIPCIPFIPCTCGALRRPVKGGKAAPGPMARKGHWSLEQSPQAVSDGSAGERANFVLVEELVLAAAITRA